ncbi:hypothetical protein Zm00014a_014086 [Zea mays]|uniref:Uncharacterized protein n=1 Tax=Zea mays TaxID=4577 RepID=A0A3L6DNK8_MAIZE|nr:hypothetical protein Zm00014a_014086 [Zea mays]
MDGHITSTLVLKPNTPKTY